VSSPTAWLTVSAAAPGKATWTAQPNPSSTPRVGTVTIAGQTFTVYQGGATDFYTVAPCRVADTRTGSPILSGTIRSLPIAGLCGIPVGAKAVSVNITAVDPTSQGYMTLFAGGTGQPAATTISFQSGVTRSNNALISLAPNGTMDAFGLVSNGGTVHLIVDVNGYFQ